jgi:crotonobetainyl-CoA:carnitine CoA-transferase CaiB-like acyl-CoA transferase
MAGALEGIKVLELASYVTGPFASVLLADLGAQVIPSGAGERNYTLRPSAASTATRRA